MQAKVLRPYQVEAVDSIINCWKQNRRCLAVMATGAGKTLVAAGTTKKVQGKVLYLANRNELCVQPMEVFAGELGFVPDLEKAESQASLSAQVVIGSVQTLSRPKRLARFQKTHFDYIFADEAHMALAPSWQRIFDHFDQAKVCGITATPFRADHKLLRDIFQAEAYRKDLFELVNDGFLVNPDNVYRLDSAISLAQVRLKKTPEGVDYDVNEAADAILPYFAEIAQELKAKHSNRHILAFLPLIASSKKFVAACRDAGIETATHIDGDDPDREQKIQAFKDGKIALLSNCSLLSLGTDLPRCDATLCLRPTRSKVLYQQIVGRSTRPLPGVVEALQTPSERLNAIAASHKPDALIIDPLWLSQDHDLVTPSFLVAESVEEAVDIQKQAGKTYSLQALKAKLQREREEAIARRLENVARFREGRVDYQYFAAQTGEHRLLNYTPVYHRECRPPSRFTLNLLAQAGIDTENVETQGLCDQIQLAIGRRRHQKRLEIRALAPIAERDGVTPDLWLRKEERKKHAFGRR